jgi:23S rRNA pseudouridine955/2504/2580 synthase
MWPDKDPAATRCRRAPLDIATLNSEKSNTYGCSVEQRIIGGKGKEGEAQSRRPPEAPGAAPAPAVRNVRIDSASAGQRLDNFLAKILKGVPKTHLYRVIRSGEVRVNKGRAGADTRLDLGDEVRIPPVRTADRSAVPPAPAREFPIVFEDDHLLAIDKPAGVAVHGGSGESFGVIEQLRRARPEAEFLELVHRLDKETSGLLLIARTRKALVALQNDLRSKRPERAIGKTYAALVAGVWPDNLKVIDVALHKYLDVEGVRRVRTVDADDADGRRSITLVRVAERVAPFTLLDVTIKTGRTHQIRVHLAHEGHPVVGDPKYGDFALNRALARGMTLPAVRFDRMFLHARRLRFTHPATSEPLELEAPLPEACAQLLNALRGAAPARP